MTGEERLQSVEKQIRDCCHGKAKMITCPYCGCENRPDNQAVCCRSFASATWAVLQRMALEDVQSHVDQVMSNN